VDFNKNQEELNIESSKQQDLSFKDNLTPGLLTLDKILKLNSLEPLLPSLNTLVKKKPHYIIILTNKAELKKNIIGNIGE
jgi:hypothetical protein